MTPDETDQCAVCGMPVAGQPCIYHARLAVFVCNDCPRTNVCGEDITDHTVYMANWWRVGDSRA